MQSKDTQISPTDRLKITYTDKPVSGWGGLVALIRFFDRIGIRELLAIALPDGRKSNNRVEVVDIVMTLFATVLTGGQRFAHASRIQADSVVQATLGVARMASATTLTRYFGGFVRSQVEHLSEVLGHFIMSRIPAPPLGAVLDLDSTVFTRYGKQQGSLKGYNPQKRGRPSHHPILAMLADSKVILHAWLRSGNSGTARGVKAFLAESLARLPKGFRLYALRADSGFYIDDFLCDLEQRQIPYAIAVRMTRPVQRSIFGIRDWVDFAPGLEAAELLYQAPSWNKPRRVVVVREEIAERPEARGRKLIDVPGYTFHAVVTCMALAPVELWRFYNSRADCENRLKELKDDFGAAGFCLDSFDGTEAVFRLIVSGRNPDHAALRSASSTFSRIV